MSRAGDDAREPLRLRGFRTFWAASTVGLLGLSLTAVAVDVLVIDVLNASEREVGAVRAAQFLPYLLFGLIAGAYVDRWRRKPTLVITEAAQGVLLLSLPVLYLADALSVRVLALVLFAAGGFAVLTAAAEQSYLPDLVPRHSLVLANARLGQSMTVAQSGGPALAGALVGALNAPAVLLLGGVGRALQAVLVLCSREPEPPPHERGHQRIWRDIVEGLRFTYGHRILAPLAFSTHVWFLANSIAMTVLGLFLLRGVGLSPLLYGVVLASAGVGGLVGALVATAAGRRWGEGTSIIVGRLLCTLAWAAMCLTPTTTISSALIAYLCMAQMLYGFAMGMEDPNEMGYWQAITPREMLGRVNATRRTANRSTAVVGALVGGVLAGTMGQRPTLAVVATVFLIAVLVAARSPLRGARA
ncbi:MAG TPA: MFS transporter [Actinomycetales bacterium]|nr:MFS transporter [Actinomycetales bacterium]